MQTISRRHILKWMGAGAIASTGAFITKAQAKQGYIELIAQKSKQSLYYDEGPKSDIWSYNGTAPGPQIRVIQGEAVRVKFTNHLDEPTSIHWHGIRISNEMDGVSGLTQKPVAPGETFTYEFKAPDAGTYWYHAHHESWNQVARGLYGSLIVEERKSPFDEEHDITLMLDDWRLQAPGILETKSMGSMMEWSHGGRMGNWITVNGQTSPQFNLRSGEHYRLRLINAANARIFELDPNRFDAKILAYDGQPLPEPQSLSYSPLLLGPAQRIDLLVTPKIGQNFELEEISSRQPFPMARFKIESGTRSAAAAALPLNSLPEPDLSKARQVDLHMIGGAMGNGGRMVYNGEQITMHNVRRTKQFWAFNNVANLSDTPLFASKRNETILFNVFNDTSFLHAMHIHGHHFRILERSESTIDEGKPWRDTFLIGPGQTTKVAFVTDNPGRWLLHCHMLEHAAAGMNTWFKVA